MTADGTVEQMLEAYAAAVRAKDVDRFLALYDDDVRVFDMWGAWSYDGADALRRMAREWFGSLGSETATVEFEDVRMVGGDDFAIAHAFVTFRGLSADGEELRSMTNRLTWALRKATGGSWKVVHEHTSAPADVDTGTVRLRR